MRLILLGPPGSGKGTQSIMLCRRNHLEHIGTGDLLRAAMRDHSPVGELARSFVESGQLVPNQIVNDLVAERFARPDRPDRFVMDGYPRTLPQAAVFDDVLARHGLSLTGVLVLVVDDEEIVRRLSGRWSCPKLGCKATYHTVSNSPRIKGICDVCGTPLVQREDDKEQTVKARLLVYHRDTAELIPFYRKRNLLQEVDGRGGIEQVYNSLSQVLGVSRDQSS